MIETMHNYAGRLEEHVIITTGIGALIGATGNMGYEF